MNNVVDEPKAFTCPGEGTDEMVAICFVCTGNTCRSPMAEALFKQLLQQHGTMITIGGKQYTRSQVKVFSAGIAANPHEPIASNAVSALLEYGLESSPTNDFEHHVATQLTMGMIKKSDYLVCMAPSHFQMLATFFPDCVSQFLMMPSAIDDPYGGDLSTYMNCLTQIKKGLEQLFFNRLENQ